MTNEELSAYRNVAPKIGDRVVLDAGVGCGLRFGVVVSAETNRWGCFWSVATTENEIETIHNNYAGAAVVAVDDEHGPWVRGQNYGGIGVYFVAALEGGSL